MEQGLASPANPALPRMPTTGRNASRQNPSHRPEIHVPTEPLATVPLVALVHPLAQHVLDRHRTTVFSVLLARTSSTLAVLPLMQTAFAPVLT